MAVELSEDDLKFFLSVDPDEDALRAALAAINADIERAKVSKIKLGIEERMGLKPPGPPGGGAAGGSGWGMAAAGGLVGAGVGIAAGWAGGAISGVIGATTKAISQLATAPFKAINAGFGLMLDVLQDIQGPLGPIGAGLNLVSKGMNTLSDVVRGMPLIGDILGSVLGSLGKLPTILKGILEAGTSLASKVSPGTVKLLGIAVEDFQATVGQMFVPVVELMTDVIRNLSDIAAQFLPDANEMRGALESVRKAWGLANVSLKEVALTFGDKVRGSIIDSIKWLGEKLAEWMPDLDQTRGALVWVQDMWSSFVGRIKAVSSQVWDFVKDTVKGIKEIGASIKEFISDVREFAKRPLSSAIGLAQAQRARRTEAEKGQGFDAQLATFNLKAREAEWRRTGIDPGDPMRGKRPGQADTAEEAQKRLSVLAAAARKQEEATKAAAGQQRPLPRQPATAARPVSIGSIEDYQRRLQMSAMAVGSTGTLDVPRNVGNLTQMVGSIEKWFQKMTPQQFQEIVKSGMTAPNATRLTVRQAEEEANAQRNRFGIPGVRGDL